MMKRLLSAPTMKVEALVNRNRISGSIRAVFFTLVVAATALQAEESRSLIGATESTSDIILKAPGRSGFSGAGQVTKVHVKEGDHVTKGQDLLDLDCVDEELEASRRRIIAESQAELDAASARERTAKLLLTGARAVAQSNQSISTEELEKRTLEAKLASTEVLRLRAGKRRENVELEQALESLRRRKLRSPIDGVVVRIHSSEGGSCDANQPLIHLVDASHCRLVCNVDEKIGRALVVGQPVGVRIQAGAAVPQLNAKLVFISTVVDQASGLIEVKAEFDNLDGSVRPGVPGTLVLDKAAVK